MRRRSVYLLVSGGKRREKKPDGGYWVMVKTPALARAPSKYPNRFPAPGQVQEGTGREVARSDDLPT